MNKLVMKFVPFRPFVPFMRSLTAVSFLVPLAVLSLAESKAFAHGVGTANAAPAVAQLSPVPQVPLLPIPLNHATPITLPRPKAELKPVPYQAGKTLKGWVIEIPGGRPICTPAFYDGKLYVGGGYGSHEFYAFDATTGNIAWQYHTDDDGPTAAVVEDGCAAFNTESCTVYVLNSRTGKLIWKEWLGDPLMSQPAISNGRLFMAYPSGQRGKGRDGHALLCADLKTGKHLWNQQIDGDVISAPIVDSDRVYLASMNGTSYCMNVQDGSIVWKKEGAATSAPVVHDAKMMMAERAGVGNLVNEGIRRIDSRSGFARDKHTIAAAPAPYIYGATNGTIGPQSGDDSVIAGYNKAGLVSPKSAASAAVAKDQWYKKMDSGVGFASAPMSAQLDKASRALGISSVAGAWGYQGARAAYHDGAVTNTQLTYVNNIDAETGKVNWRAQAQAPFVTGTSQVFSPPSLGQRNMYLCSGDGHLVCLDQKTGAVRYMYATGRPISFQPALANGKVYIGTANGQLLCVDGQDADAQDWTAWGGNAQHNKTK